MALGSFGSTRPLLAVLALGSTLGCAGSETPPPAAPPAAPVEMAAPPPPVAGDTETDATAERAAEPADPLAAPEADASAPAAAAAAGDDANAPRQVRYVVTPDGLRVRVAGVELSPKAELVQKSGSLQIKLQVGARSDDGNSHSLLAPAAQELAFAGVIRRSDGSEEKFVDERGGERELVVSEGSEVALSRSFPNKGMKPLRLGDELELAVGLWGLGDDAETRRPVRGVCKVTLSYPRKNKPRLKLAPPDGVAK